MCARPKMQKAAPYKGPLSRLNCVLEIYSAVIHELALERDGAVREALLPEFAVICEVRALGNHKRAARREEAAAVRDAASRERERAELVIPPAVYAYDAGIALGVAELDYRAALGREAEAAGDIRAQAERPPRPRRP